MDSSLSLTETVDDLSQHVTLHGNLIMKRLSASRAILYYLAASYQSK